MLQTGEIVVIALLALVLLGPRRLPEIARKLGRWTSELRNAARDITRGLESEVADIREVGKELRAPLDEVKRPLTEIRDEVTGFGPKGHEWKGPKPVTGPTPEDAMRDLEEMNRLAAAGQAGEGVAEVENPPSKAELESEPPPDPENEPKE
jgi:sec-independent protein translocase protein TatB